MANALGGEFVTVLLAKQLANAFISLVARKKKNGPALWETKQLAVDQVLSMTTYFHIAAVAGNSVTVEDQNDTTMNVSKDIIEKMASGSHSAKEVGMNMTALAELLETLSDTVFTVTFQKQATVDRAKELLDATSVAQLKDQKNLSQIVKDLTQGELCTMTCHLVKVENNLGRSTVIDLTARTDNKFRQIDHRTIQWIVYKNVKYVLKKGGKKEEEGEEEKKKKDELLWDSKQLAVGNWFSSTSYYTVKAINGDNVTTINDHKKEIVITRDILEHDMHNACVFAKTEKLALNKVVKILKEAQSVSLTINFNTKIDEKVVLERLAKATDKDLNDSKTLAKDLLTGEEKTFIGRLSKTEGKLGRSLMIGLPQHNFI